MNNELVMQALFGLILISTTFAILCGYMDFKNNKKIQKQDLYISSRRSMQYFKPKNERG